MVTKRELEWAEYYATWVSRVQLLAIEWNPGTRLLSVTTKKWKLVLNACYLIWHAYVAFYSVMRFRQTSTGSSGRVGVLLRIMYMSNSLAEISTFCINLSLFVSRNELVNLLNQLIFYNSKPGKTLLVFANIFGNYLPLCSGKQTSHTHRESIIKFFINFFKLAASMAAIFLITSEYISFAKTGSMWTPFLVMKVVVHPLYNCVAMWALHGLMQMYLIIFFSMVYDYLPK